MKWLSDQHYSKNLYPLWNCIILSEAAVRDQKPWCHRLSGSWTLDDCWVGNNAIPQWVCVLAFIPWPTGMRGAGSCKIMHFPTPCFPTHFDTSYRGIIKLNISKEPELIKSICSKSAILNVCWLIPMYANYLTYDINKWQCIDLAIAMEQ